ncbi:MAG: hypothetical protein QM496_01995 [Verrucomicrobiota bacterium]
MGLFNNPIYIAELTDNKSEAEIIALKDKVRAALESRVSVNIHITTSSMGDRNAAGITLAKPEDQLDFIAACQAALANLAAGQPVVDSRAFGSGTDYSHQPLRS